MVTQCLSYVCDKTIKKIFPLSRNRDKSTSHTAISLFCKPVLTNCIIRTGTALASVLQSHMEEKSPSI